MSEEHEGPSRRTFMAGAAAGVAGVGAALSPLRDVRLGSIEAWLQQHYHELGPDEMKDALARIEREAKEDLGVDLKCKDVKPTAKTKYAYALNLGVCVGCRKCAYACQNENTQRIAFDCRLWRFPAAFPVR